MFPLNWNFPIIKKNGKRSTIGAEIDASGGDPYELPTASTNVKGGIKIGNNLTMNGEKLNADPQLPEYSESEEGKILSVNSSGQLAWTPPAGGMNITKFKSDSVPSSLADDGLLVILNHGDNTTATISITIPGENTYSLSINNATRCLVSPVTAGTTLSVSNDGGLRNTFFYYH